jgi:hypothetical protein
MIPIKFEPIIDINLLEMFNRQHKEWPIFSYKMHKLQDSNQAPNITQPTVIAF